MADVIPRDPRPPREGGGGTEPLWREAVGRELREARLAAHRTLADVAAEAGLSMQYLSEIERGTKEPSSEMISAVCGALGLRLLDLTARVSRSLTARPATAYSGQLSRTQMCLAA